MSQQTCLICDKPASPYPNWILVKNVGGMHIGCLCEDYRQIRTAHKLLYERVMVAGTWGPWADGGEGSYEQRHWGDDDA